LISKFAQYFQSGDEKTLLEILRDVNDEDSEKLLSDDLLVALKSILCKKAYSLVVSNQLTDNLDELNAFLDRNGHFLLSEEDAQDYANESFQCEIRELVKAHVYSKNTSVLLEMINNHNMSNESVEDELLRHVTSFRKRKLVTPLRNMDESFFNTSHNQSSTFQRQNKKLRIEDDNNKENKTPNVCSKSTTTDVSFNFKHVYYSSQLYI
jgi:hypothetical protein